MRNILGLLFVSGLALREVPTASPQDGGTLGLSQRGPGAHVRARIDRVHRLASTEADEATRQADELLTELQDRRGLEADPLTEETREVLARELVGVRTRLAVAGMTAVQGFRTEFISRVAEGAAWADYLLGVPASITVAQAILESDWGRSAPGFNLFGLKGEGPEGSTLRRVVEYRHGRRSVQRAKFRAYASFDGSLLDHASILAGSRHYARARRVAEDPARYARALQGTYATDPRYADKLIGLIDRYGLDRLDWSVPSPWRR